VVLPILYSIFHLKDKKKLPGTKRTAKVTGLAILFFACNSVAQAQDSGLHFDEIHAIALNSNSGLRASKLKVDESKALIGSAFNFDKTDLYYHYDQNNLAFNNEPLEVFGIQQNFLFPSVYFAEKGVNKANYLIEKSGYELKKRILEQALASNYHALQYARQKEKTYGELNELYEKFSYSAQRRFELGESNYLEKITAQAKQRELQALYKKAVEDTNLAFQELIKTVQPDSTLLVKTMPMEKLQITDVNIEENAGMSFFENRRKMFDAQSTLEQQHLLPDLNFNYFQGTNSTLGENLYGFQVGIKIPLFFSGNASKIKAAKIAKEVSSAEANDYAIQLRAKYQSLLGQLNKYEEVLAYYETEGQGLADEIIKTATLSYQSGEIDFFQYIQSMENGYTITLTYLENLNAYNQTVIAINYLNL
jgi:cobalt-zinc-cadmium resistance protein CzcA